MLLRIGFAPVIIALMDETGAYCERRSVVDGTTVWTRLADGTSSWILPDGCIDILWNGTVLTVAGPDTTAHLASAERGTPFTALRFASGVGPTVLGVAADGLRDERVDLCDVIGVDAADMLARSLSASVDPAAELERWAGRRLALGGGRDRTMSRVAMLIGAGTTVADVASHMGFSERQLNRRSLASFGYGPKMLGRVLRLQRALSAARRGMPLVQVSIAAGYSDQAHFSHDALALTGQTPSQLAGRGA